MATTLPKRTPLAQLSSIQATSRPPARVVHGREMLALVRQAMNETGLKQQAAAAAAGVKESQFSSALNGSGNFAVTWLWAQSDEFLLRFVELLIAARRLTPESARAARAERVGELVRLLLEDVR